MLEFLEKLSVLPSEPVSRRTFLAASGSAAALAATMVAAPLAVQAQASPTPEPPATGNPPGTGSTPPPPSTPKGKPLPPLALEPISEKTDREEEEAPTAVPPDRRIGFAIVGLGRLSLLQILPGFAQSKRCKPVALVSGDRNKALRVAEQCG